MSTATGRAVQIGMNDRLFASNLRPILEDIAFAGANGFELIQFHGTLEGVGEAEIGKPLAEVGAALAQHGVGAVMEIIVRVDGQARTTAGQTPLAVLRANLSAIQALRCTRVHWHPIHTVPLDTAGLRELEQRMLPFLAQAVDLARSEGFVFGFEHNEPKTDLFSTPEVCAATLAEVAGLGFVWDLNHTPPEWLDAFLELTPRMSLLHVADTPLPEVNHHLPLGRGSIDFPAYFQALLARGFRGPAILEIGGLPRSGGYGQDSDEALIDSRARLLAALE
ncbi:MAG: hypothetical protein OHK0022_32220 [Roseiflexaceae bacterium]